MRRRVVLSHGTGGSTVADHDQAATLVRAGPSAWQTRPQGVTRMFDALARHPQWQPLPAPGFDARQRDAAFARIAAFHQRELAR